jgi:NitT/TauT family transport system substrate-binding protein
MVSRRSWTSSLCAVVLVVVAVALAACGSDSSSDSGSSASSGSSTSGGSSGDLTTVKVGVLPISALAPLYLGMERGIFERHGLELEPEVAQSGAAIVPAVISGQQQFGFANVVSLMVAHDKGLPVKIVAKGSQAGPGASQRFEGVIVKGDGPIRTPADLAGKTVSVNAINDIGGLLINGALERVGVDPRSIRFLELGFPDANAAVDAGRVDGAYQTEPFLSQAVQAGDRVVLYQYPKLGREITIASYFTSDKYAQENPEVVREFRAAMDESLTYATAHEDEVRQVVTTFTRIPAEAARTMTLPGWDPNLDPSTNGLDLVAQLATQSGLVRTAPNFDELIVH